MALWRGEFQTRDVQFYNLDAIISVGYRVNSRKATAFRQWATTVLKQYMLKGYVVNHNAVSEQSMKTGSVCWDYWKMSLART